MVFGKRFWNQNIDLRDASLEE